MNQDIIDTIDQAKERTLAGGKLDRSVLKRFLELDPESAEMEYLGNQARDVARIVSMNKGKVWAAIGIDYQSCNMNCQFCAFGEKWGLIKDPRVLTDDEVFQIAQDFVSKGASWIVLRTTQFFDTERLNGLARRIKGNLRGKYEIVVNTGEFNQAIAKRMADSGIDMIYHTIRLGEGKTTSFDPLERIKTLGAVRDSPLKLAFLIEPVGVEHTNDEILDSYSTGTVYGSVLSGAMARVNIKNTPFEGKEAVSEMRMAQIVAITRIAGGIHTPDICVHPPYQKAIDWGANVVVVEKGAIPRNEKECEDDWRMFDIAAARKMFTKAGYDLVP